MASDKGPIASEAPLVASSAPQAAAAAAIVASELLAPEGNQANRTPSLKRQRETTPSPVAATAGQGNPDLSPSKIQRLGLASRQSPTPLTGAAAEEEERLRRAEEARQAPETSDNPSRKVLAALMSATNMAMSRPQDASQEGEAATEIADAFGRKPTTDLVDVPPAQAPSVEHAAEQAAEHPTGTSPQSATSIQSLGGTHQVVHSPAPMDIDQRNDHAGGYVAQPEAPMEEKNTAYSYPGILPANVAMGAPNAPQRGMSLPMSTSQHPELAPRSPSSKKHKCPYCDTEFTRHHNLKSHLLTHSQEKPYVCQTCTMRFRRLHDLKRHSKLHTGEKPHICPKCDRKFARGDALARHAKGAGGCAGRRSSMGSFGGDDYDDSMAHDGDDSVMSGVVYDTGNEADMTEDERRRLSLSVTKPPHISGAPAPDGFNGHARSFPQVAPSRQGTSGGITESPKPLSPGDALTNQSGHDPASSSANTKRDRTPSMSATQEIARQIYARRQPELTSPLTAAAPAPAPTLAPAGTNHQAAGPGGGGAHSRASSGPSHGQSGGSGDSSANLFASGESGVWAYIHSIDSKWEAAIKPLLDRVAAVEASKEAMASQIAFLDGRVAVLAHEVAFLRQQLRTEATTRQVASAVQAQAQAQDPGQEQEQQQRPPSATSPPDAASFAASAAAAVAAPPIPKGVGE